MEILIVAASFVFGMGTMRGLQYLFSVTERRWGKGWAVLGYILGAEYILKNCKFTVDDLDDVKKFKSLFRRVYPLISTSPRILQQQKEVNGG